MASPADVQHGLPHVRDGGAMTWTTQALDPATLQKQGWTVFSLHQLREQYISPARAAGLQRTSLDNPAAPMLRLFAANARIAVLGAVTKTPADLRELYGYIVEPAYRAGTTLLVATDRELDDLDPADFIEPIGYAWSLERLQHLAALYRVSWVRDGQPPMTPIETRLFTAMRDRGLAPEAQYGIRRFRVDFAFPDLHLAVECDGRPYHDPAADARRDERLRRVGWHVLHFTGSEIFRDAGACAEHVVAAVRQRQLGVPTKAPVFWVDERSSWLTRIGTWIRRMFRRGTPSPLLAPATIVIDEPDEDIPTARRWTAGLDAEQQSSVGAHDGVVQVIAPAGSGKTTVLVARVRELLARGVPPNRILCLTFNTAAAAELNTRLHQLGIDSVEASTFHALGRRILKDEGVLRGDVGTLSYAQWRRLAKFAMDQTEDGVWIDAPEAKDQVSGLKLGRMMTVDEFAAVARTPEERTLAALYRLYQDDLAEQGRCDFDDFIFEGLRLLQRVPEARRKWQQSFQAVLVDEYQDIEPAQELLVHILAAPEDMLFCVGDEDQCLYAWRRATVERVIELDQTFPGLQRHALGRNYRCPSLVVDASRALIVHNHRRFPKRIHAVREDPGRITLVAAADMAAQAAHAARLVSDLSPKQVVVLARTSRVLSEVAVGLAQAGVRFYGPERLLRQRGEPAVLLAYMRLLGQPSHAREDDVEAVFRVPNRFLPDGAALNVASGLRSGLDFQAVIARLNVRETWRADRLAEAGHLFDELSGIPDAAELIHALRTEGGLDRHYSSAERLNPTDVSDVDALERAQDQAAGMSVIEYANALDYEAHIIEQHFDKKGVELATIHGAKGREWPTVIVVGVQTDELPHRRSLLNAVDGVGELEAERRLAYVAITRVTQHLVLMHDRDTPSQFLAEMAPVAERTDLEATWTAADGDHGGEPTLTKPTRQRVAVKASERSSGASVISDGTGEPSAVRCHSCGGGVQMLRVVYGLRRGPLEPGTISAGCVFPGDGARTQCPACGAKYDHAGVMLQPRSPVAEISDEVLHTLEFRLGVSDAAEASLKMEIDNTRVLNDAIAAILQQLPGRSLSLALVTHVLRGSPGPKTRELVATYHLPHDGSAADRPFSDVRRAVLTAAQDDPRLAVAGNRVVLRSNEPVRG